MSEFFDNHTTIIGFLILAAFVYFFLSMIGEAFNHHVEKRLKELNEKTNKQNDLLSEIRDLLKNQQST